ncbi:uncharacterized protein [Arachis hypogaea]|uniref:uncharacterized protein isoform X2 n=1 Tax=Arachis hypogaea TaxID=3818 RepID=UPI000DEC34CF|nr:uncharacterized protein LOC112696966 isoform X2 [Arachis hypogaea]QHO46984.1 uncharacterized protein DS421_6g192390 [Arachis hypogaea]
MEARFCRCITPLLLLLCPVEASGRASTSPELHATAAAAENRLGSLFAWGHREFLCRPQNHRQTFRSLIQSLFLHYGRSAERRNVITYSYAKPIGRDWFSSRLRLHGSSRDSGAWLGCGGGVRVRRRTWAAAERR